ncbi:hypothetical protein [Moraxella bovis]|uniref:Uncharacterized protein n=1 Tax=Moraxella bovis TaxID=476 RepID=A0A1T0A2F1_MORBO|nr:hypothetical protein [Moraxella bovis]OOR89818.1 hypothetical protein B0182_06595 [Moraxella bovis]STY90183.1 Uncharacterised protein [Moraxella bovis]
MKHKIPKAQLIAVAESFAGVSPFADACYRYYFYQDKTARAYLTATLATEFAEYFAGIDAKYHANIIATALTEISYPTPIGKRFAFSERERAITARISRQTWRTHGMNTAVDNIISHITGIAKVVAVKVKEQLGKNFNMGY